MARKKERAEEKKAHILGGGEIINQPVTQTLEINYMPYAMSVILSRAIPEIDGFKPSHRKLLYTMYKMGLLNAPRVKSAKIVGATMELNPHGDAAIYETMVRLSRGYEALLHPYVDSKGNFGKAYSRDMSYAAPRYTEARLEKIAEEIFRDIDKDTVDFTDNYDASTKEPVLLPVSFPNILANSNTGIAVGMASSICSFNLKELCETTAALIKNPQHRLKDTLRAPDFPGGGIIVYDDEVMDSVFEKGKGSITVRSKYFYDRKNNCIDITEIPPTTTAEAVIENIIKKTKSGEFREISDIRDETDKSGLKITVDLRRGADADRLMHKLFKRTPLEDVFSCNFNVLIDGTPKVLGVRELLSEWIAFRTQAVRRRVRYDLETARKKLHLLRGLEKILLDIDKAIKIIRETEEEAEVVPNLMIGFGIDELQAEFVADIKLRHLNREYIMKKLSYTEELASSVEDMKDILSHERRLSGIIVKELGEVAKKYGKPRKSEIVYNLSEAETDGEEEDINDYPCTFFFSRDGYFKKITPQSLRMSGAQKFKEGDALSLCAEGSNTKELLFFTDRAQVYKARAFDFEDSKASLLGDYIPAVLDFEEGESPVYLGVFDDYSGYMLFFFENGKVAKVSAEAYSTKTKRRKLLNAYSSKSPLVSAFYIREEREFLLSSSAGHLFILNTALISAKASRDTQGVSVLSLKKGHRLLKVRPYTQGELKNEHRYRTKNLPSRGALLRRDEENTQLSF